MLKIPTSRSRTMSQTNVPHSGRTDSAPSEGWEVLSTGTASQQGGSWWDTGASLPGASSWDTGASRQGGRWWDTGASQPGTSSWEAGASQPEGSTRDATADAPAPQQTQPGTSSWETGASQPEGSTRGATADAPAPQQTLAIAKCAGASQPGDAADAPLAQLIAQRPFFTDVLPRQHRVLDREKPNRAKAGTLREVVDQACGPLYDHLPLSTSAFATFDVAEALGEPGAIVVAEVIKRVPDANRPPRNRVDLFCYKDNGDVVRHHPGRTKAQSMKPHCMPSTTLLFHSADAAQNGVGAALHATPPGLLSLGGTPHTTRQHLDALHPYDVTSVNWKQVRALLRALPDHDDTVNWSEGIQFPWWVWLANTGILRDVVGDGVDAVELSVIGGRKYVVVHSINKTWWLYDRGGKMVAADVE